MASVLGGILRVIAGGLLTSFGLPQIGIPLFQSGMAEFGAALLAASLPEPLDETQSVVYGYRQYTNPVKANAVRPVIYSVDGIRTAPIWTQAWVTPIGHDDAEEARTQSRKGQRLSGVLTVAEGPIVGMLNLRFNDEFVFEAREDYAVGTGNGSKRTFVIKPSRIDMDSVRVYVAEELKGWLEEEVIERVADAALAAREMEDQDRTHERPAQTRAIGDRRVDIGHAGDALIDEMHGLAP